MHRRNDITLAVDTIGRMYVAQGNPALEKLDEVIGTGYDCETGLYHSQVYHRCAALTPDGWQVMCPSDATREGYEWTRFSRRISMATGTPRYMGRAWRAS